MHRRFTSGLLACLGLTLASPGLAGASPAPVVQSPSPADEAADEAADETADTEPEAPPTGDPVDEPEPARAADTELEAPPTGAPAGLGTQPVPQNAQVQAQTIQAGQEAYAAGNLRQAYLSWIQAHPLILTDVTAPTHEQLETLTLDLISACEAMAIQGQRNCLESTRILAEQTATHADEHRCADATMIRAHAAKRLVPPVVRHDEVGPAPAKQPEPGVGLMVAGAAVTTAGAALAALGGIGYALNQSLCEGSLPLPCGEGGVSTTLAIGGGVVALVGLSILIAGAVRRDSAKRPAATTWIAPAAGPGMGGLVVTGRF